MSPRKKTLWFTVVPAAILAGFLLVRGRAHPQPVVPADEQAPLVPATVAQKTSIANQLTISAEFRPFQEVDVHAKVAGYVKVITVDVGDHVKAGQVLAVLEVPELDAELKEAEGSIRRSQAEIVRLRSEVTRAESAHSAAHSNATRLQEVMKSQPNLVAQQELDDVIAKDKTSEADVESSRAGFTAAQEQLSVAEANRDRIATLKSYARITAPFDGVVTKRYADTGSMIQAGTASNTQAMPLVRIAQNQKLRLVIPVPEAAAANIHLRAPVEVRVDSLGKSFAGSVARFADSVDPATRTMETEVDVPNPKDVLMPGMFASAVLMTQSKKDAVTVPVQAVARSGDQALAMVIRSDGKLDQRKLVLGIESPDRVEVISGIEPGERVLLGNQSQYQSGQVVRPRIIEADLPPRKKS